MKTKIKIIKVSPKRLSMTAPALVKEELLYDSDFFKWIDTQVNLLKKGKLDKLDVKNLIEEIESLGKRERSALRSHIANWLMHMLKITYQPEKHTKSWNMSIANSKVEIEWLLKDSPSLHHVAKDIINESYKAARLKAAAQTKLDIEIFPKESPWKMKDILGDKKN